MRRIFVSAWRWSRKSLGRRVLAAVALGAIAATVVLAFDVRARVSGSMTYCGNGIIGVYVPLFDDPPQAFLEECGAAVRRWRIAAAAVAVLVSALALIVGEISVRRSRAPT